MTPSTALRLQSMMRSMRETIVPALDPSDSLAQEQAQLMMGHINALIQQQGKERDIHQTEYQAMRDLASALLAVADGGSETLRAQSGVESALQGQDPIALSLAVEQLARTSDASEAFKSQSWQLVLDYAKPAALRAQSWFSPMGFA